MNIHNVDINNFALFGLNVQKQIITDSKINVTMLFEVLSGSLICYNCDVHILRATLVFIASGYHLSGILIEPCNSIVLIQIIIQNRFSSEYSSGVANQVREALKTFVVDSCKLMQHNMIISQYNGYLVSNVEVDITIEMVELYVCVEQIERFGQYKVQIDLIGSDTIQCNLCQLQHVSYGLCVDQLLYGELVAEKLICKYPFVFVLNQCECAFGYLLNQSTCINVVDTMTNIFQNLVANSTNLEQSIIYNYTQTDNNLFKNTTNLENMLQSNISAVMNTIYSISQYLENNIVQNWTLADNNLKLNVSAIDQRILNNISLTNNNLKINTSNLEQFIISNYSLFYDNIQQSIINTNLQLIYNTSQFQTYLFNNISYINSMSSTLNLEIQNQQNSLVSLQNLLMCTKQCGHALINNICTLVYCFVQGQIIINNQCQCAHVYEYVSNNQCICPSGSTVVGNSCSCNIISGQTMSNGQCVCSDSNAIVSGSACIVPAPPAPQCDGITKCGANNCNVIYCGDQGLGCCYNWTPSTAYCYGVSLWVDMSCSVIDCSWSQDQRWCWTTQ
ncbi:Hypothetical_protein [Hexamita inflata]|uniref:Hypothetical_protein n=1 Tax=Hexamita inflata TaxID=28002 RepID=A0AA86RGG2_9EUKA|nr:Hypothetical protein HINF_LOCUS54310 [Hexamita inflata]